VVFLHGDLGAYYLPLILQGEKESHRRWGKCF